MTWLHYILVISLSAIHNSLMALFSMPHLKHLNLLCSNSLKQLDDSMNIILQLTKKLTVFSLVPGFAQALNFSVKSVKVKELLHTIHGLIPLPASLTTPDLLICSFFFSNPISQDLLKQWTICLKEWKTQGKHSLIKATLQTPPLLIPAQESTVRPDNGLMQKCSPTQELTVSRNGRAPLLLSLSPLLCLSFIRPLHELV